MEEKYFIKTERIGLRTLQLTDLEGGYSNWLNDPEVCRYNSHHRFPQTEDNLRTYIEGIGSNRTLIVFALVDLSTGKHIGNISLQNINMIDRNAELAFIIGEKEFNHKGYASEAAKAIIDHAFKELNLHRLYLGTADNNIAMIKLAGKLGFEEEGRRRDAFFKCGEYHDVVEFGLINREKIE